MIASLKKQKLCSDGNPCTVEKPVISVAKGSSSGDSTKGSGSGDETTDSVKGDTTTQTVVINPEDPDAPVKSDMLELSNAFRYQLSVTIVVMFVSFFT